jgi:hypothetical protein
VLFGTKPSASSASASRSSAKASSRSKLKDQQELKQPTWWSSSSSSSSHPVDWKSAQQHGVVRAVAELLNKAETFARAHASNGPPVTTGLDQLESLTVISSRPLVLIERIAGSKIATVDQRSCTQGWCIDYKGRAKFAANQ